MATPRVRAPSLGTRCAAGIMCLPYYGFRYRMSQLHHSPCVRPALQGHAQPAARQRPCHDRGRGFHEWAGPGTAAPARSRAGCIPALRPLGRASPPAIHTRVGQPHCPEAATAATSADSGAATRVAEGCRYSRCSRHGSRRKRGVCSASGGLATGPGRTVLHTMC